MADLQLFVDPAAPSSVPDALTFETGATRHEVIDPTLWAYEHHGEDFGSADPGALTCLFEDLALGRPTPARMVVRGIGDADTLLAITLFLHRDLVVRPETMRLVAQVDFLHRQGFQVMGHLDTDVARFIRLLRAQFRDNLPARERDARIQKAVGWIREYLLEGRLPALGAPFPVPRILDTGPGGFVVAETDGSLPEGWVELYRQGHIRGVLFGPRKGTLLPALVSRKSAFVPLDLHLAAYRLNESEVVLGGSPRWLLEGDWLWSPPEGSLIRANAIVGAVVGVELPLVPEQGCG